MKSFSCPRCEDWGTLPEVADAGALKACPEADCDAGAKQRALIPTLALISTKNGGSLTEYPLTPDQAQKLMGARLADGYGVEVVNADQIDEAADQ